MLEANKAVAGTPLSIAGRKFGSGLGTHANSEIVYSLEPGFETFTAWVGVDDHLKNHPESPKASVIFRVLGDDKELFSSGVMRINDPAKRLSVSVAGINELKLLVSDAGDGNSCDHADWAEPVLTGTPTAPENPTPARFVKAPGITASLSNRGALVGVECNGKAWEISGLTQLRGLRQQGETTATGDPAGCSFTRTLADAKGHTCSVTDRFSTDAGAIRWEVAITSADAPWTTPIITRLKASKPDEKLIWTGWGSPDFSGTQLTPELAALVQAGKTSVGGNWSDPLVPTGFTNRTWHYGNVAQNCPVGSDYIALPLFTLLAPACDSGLSLVLSPEDVLLNLDLTISTGGQFQFTRSNHRLGGGRTVTFTQFLVPHESDWRGGLRFLTTRYPAFFESPNPRAQRIGGCGAYTLCEERVDPVRLRKMAFGFNWKLSDDFPYMGMFIPPVKDMTEQWTRSCDERETLGQGTTTSCRQMNDYAKYMKSNGFSVLSYFNVTEFGKNMNQNGQRQPQLASSAPDLWKDPAAYLKYRLPNAVFDPNIGTCYAAYITDPGDPDYMKHLLEQSARNTTLLPDTDGICIDRTDWLRLYNPKADDGVSWINGKPARSLFRSWIALMSQMGPQMHQADKVIFSNMMTMRLELCRELDGIYTEFGNNGNALNASALLCVNKPAVAWSYNETLNQPNPDAFMQRHLHLGVFPTAPYPRNNHCINPSPQADSLYLDYGPLLSAMRSKKWVLAPHCVETTTPGVKVNLFTVPGGYALPITFGGSATSATVVLRNLPDLGKLTASVLHPGASTATPIQTRYQEGALYLTVPLSRGCAMVSLRNSP